MLSKFRKPSFTEYLSDRHNDVRASYNLFVCMTLGNINPRRHGFSPDDGYAAFERTLKVADKRLFRDETHLSRSEKAYALEHAVQIYGENADPDFMRHLEQLALDTTSIGAARRLIDLGFKYSSLDAIRRVLDDAHRRTLRNSRSTDEYVLEMERVLRE
jgi:hypothetical protein